MARMTYAQAALQAVIEEMRRDPKIFYLTTDQIPALGKEFGPLRTRPTPIAESAMTGMAIGAAG
jgi:pyruvate/2-oxoglutarate/acetoin dehydrogenase E1 component